MKAAPHLGLDGQEMSQADESTLYRHFEMNDMASPARAVGVSPDGETQNHQQKGTAMDINSDQAKGRVKEAVGYLTDNDKLKNEGKADKAAGDVKQVVDDAAGKAEDLVDKVKDAVTKDRRDLSAGRPYRVTGRPAACREL